MASVTLNATGRGSGNTSYSQYTSTLHLGGGYRAYAKFNLSGIPADATITAVELRMNHSASTYAAAQSVTFKTSSSSAWSYTSTGSATVTSSKVSGNTYKWNLTSLASKMLSLGSSCNLHMSTSDGQDRPYDGTQSKVQLIVTYEVPTPPPPTSQRTMHRWNGDAWETCDAYRWDGSAWVACDAHRYDGSEWI